MWNGGVNAAENARVCFEQKVRQVIDAVLVDPGRMEEESLAREYGLDVTMCLPLREWFKSLRRWLPLGAGALPQEPGILEIGLPGMPVGIRFHNGTHVPYPVQFVETDNLGSAQRALAQEWSSPKGILRYVSYVTIADPEHRSIFASALRRQFQRDSEASLPSFTPIYLRVAWDGSLRAG